ncbi:integral membrane sensor hybrid histidine kinase (plasmid) [Thalassoporum mexicanum PCC 7367]|uniref:CHASE2 domain-containing protein n=1 Tax=Thalassoporum mexicanum TaxID=3457544 RepID=UPI00029F991D|nr:CHASE2 domain-containing protein [Pseudanabaena sp. PCC 7367]AFY72166.1 integral membrane sensor hybrid histidine kinase [Pseudanabaena sp. PCC 7367]
MRSRSKLRFETGKFIKAGIAAIAVTVVVVALRFAGAFQLWELVTLDRFFQLAPAQNHPERVVIVAIDETFIRTNGTWPMPDADLATVIEQISAQQPVAIGLDIYRDLPVEPGHQKLVEIYQTTPNLIGIEKVTSDEQAGIVAPPPELEALDQVAFNDVVLDDDGTLRRALLSIRIENDEIYLSLPLRLALMYLEREGIFIKPIDAEQSTVGLGRAVFESLTRNDGGYVRADDNGYQIMLNYHRHTCQEQANCEVFKTVSIADVLAGKVEPDLFRDRLVLIGSTAESIKDRFFTPFTHSNLTAAPGVEIHAYIIDHLLAAAIDGQPVLYGWAEPQEIIWILVWAAVGGTIGVWFISDRWRGLLVFAIALGLVLVLPYGLFLIGSWGPLPPALIALLGAAIVTVGWLLLDNLKRSYRQLSEYSRTLEQRVLERTAELAENNRLLEIEIKERITIQDQLQAAKAAAEAANIAKSRFLANMSHEIRTPINGIIGMMDLLQYTPLNAEQTDFLSTMRNSTQSLMLVINDILDLSKLEAGQMQLELKRFKLNDCVEGVMELMAGQASQKQLEMAIYIAPDVPLHLVGDAYRLRQVLTNLVSNAIKFTEKGVIKTTLKLGYVTADTVEVRFEVSDTGIGIAANKQNVLFQSFSQVDISTTRKYGGTGLGLAICKQIVGLMMGEIGVESESGQGSTFWFTAVFAKVKFKPDRQPRQLFAAHQSLAGVRLVIIEPSKTTRQIVENYARVWGMKVDSFATIRAALLFKQNLQQNLQQDLAPNFKLADGGDAHDSHLPRNLGWDFGVVSLDALDSWVASQADYEDDTLGKALEQVGPPGAIELELDYCIPPELKELVIEHSHVCWLVVADVKRRDQADKLVIIDRAYAFVIKPLRAARLLGCFLGMAEGEPFEAVLDDMGTTGKFLPDSDPSQAKIRVLLVEDNPVNQKVARKQLERLGYEVTCVDDGQKALVALIPAGYANLDTNIEAKAREGVGAIANLPPPEFDVVLMDCQMPRLDGYEATRRLRAWEEQLYRQHVPRHMVVVGLTANAMKGDREKCLAAGMDDYLSKPVVMNDLNSTLKRWLSNRVTS